MMTANYRQSTMSYIASLTSRALFVSVPVLFSCLEKISGWIHGYIDNSAGSGPSLHSHGPFYSACQALFYMFDFRREELTVSKKHLAFLRYWILTQQFISVLCGCIGK